MNIAGVPFSTTDWSAVDAVTKASGVSGTVTSRTRTFGDIRVRLVDYSANYVADHWCHKGHILLCIEGEIETELADGRRFTLTPGHSYQVADHSEPHRSSTRTGARLFIVD
jgi:hypothetical protein